jgi:hypothetical protein
MKIADVEGGVFLIDYRIMPAAGYGKRVADVVSMLEHSRSVTLSEIQGLDQSRLDFLLDDASNSIGALLMHVAAIEFVHTIITFELRDLNEDEKSKWGTAWNLGAWPGKNTEARIWIFMWPNLMQSGEIHWIN